MKKALQIIDGLQAKYRGHLHAAIKERDKGKIAHWGAYLSALTVAALEIEKSMGK